MMAPVSVNSLRAEKTYVVRARDTRYGHKNGDLEMIGGRHGS
jgi:hypothetical protein